MAVRLDMLAGPDWYELVSGVRILAEPFDGGAQDDVQDQIAEMGLFAEGEDGDQILDMSEREVSRLFAKCVAARVIVDWEGVEASEGVPAEVTPEAVHSFLDLAPIYEAFSLKYMAKFMLADQEKNGSSPLPSGNSAGAGKATAKTVRKPARTAHTKPTPSSRGKRARSGK